MAMNYYFKDQLDVNPALLQFLQNTINLPYLAKPIYGIISDTIYIGGAHRLPYFTLAGLFQLVSWGMIIMHGGAKSLVAVLAAVLTLSNLGAALSEVVSDALIAESGKRKGARTGELQSFAWLATAVGGLVGNLFGGLALRKLGFEVICSIFAAFVALHLIISSTISEGSLGLQPKRFIVYKELSDIASGNAAGRWWENIHMQQMQQQTCVLFQLLKKPKFYQPILWFMGSSAIVPTITSSMFYYQSQHLGINAFYLGLAKMIGQVGLLAGSVTYNKYFKSVSLQKVTQFLQILLSICIASDILLVNRLNLCLGIPDHLYIFGASAFVEAVAQFKGLPFAVFLAKSCPQGSEGSLLALFMASQCLASIVSGYLGVALAFSLHISASNFANLPFGIFVQSLAALLPLLWLTWLPDEDTVNKIN